MLSNAVAVTPTFTALSTPTVLTFTLTVTDAYGLADATPDMVVITVTDVSITGLSAANSSPTKLGQATRFTATITGGSNVMYQWNFGDGYTSSGVIATHAYTAARSYTAIVTAANGISMVAANTLVTITNLPPVANAGSDQNVKVSAPVTLNGSASSDPDGHTPLTYRWKQTGGTSVILSNAAAVSPSFTAPSTPTVLTFTLTVTDTYGLADATPDMVVITVTDASITGLSAANSSPTLLGQTTRFTATITGGTNVTYQWNFGDGKTGSGVTTTHTYTTAGPYTATVTATNSAGSKSVNTPVAIWVRVYLPLIRR